MSAWIVSKKHIDAMVASALNRWNARGLPGGAYGMYWDKAPVDLTRADAIGRMLIEENVRSVCDCYNQQPTDADLPGPVHHYWLEPYQFPVFTRAPKPVVGLKAIACYEYQSCETADYYQSKAHDFCNILRKHLIEQLPGYHEAPWGID